MLFYAIDFRKTDFYKLEPSQRGKTAKRNKVTVLETYINSAKARKHSNHRVN